MKDLGCSLNWHWCLNGQSLDLSLNLGNISLLLFGLCYRLRWLDLFGGRSLYLLRARSFLGGSSDGFPEKFLSLFLLLLLFNLSRCGMRDFVGGCHLGLTFSRSTAGLDIFSLEDKSLFGLPLLLLLGLPLLSVLDSLSAIGCDLATVLGGGFRGLALSSGSSGGLIIVLGGLSLLLFLLALLDPLLFLCLLFSLPGLFFEGSLLLFNLPYGTASLALHFLYLTAIFEFFQTVLSATLTLSLKLLLLALMELLILGKGLVPLESCNTLVFLIDLEALKILIDFNLFELEVNTDFGEFLLFQG